MRKEVLFFNNFLQDPKRPALPEGKGGPPPGPAQGETPKNPIGDPKMSPKNPIGDPKMSPKMSPKTP